MGTTMHCAELRNSLNDVLDLAVRVQSRCGSNRTGAIATVAHWLGVSPRIVEMRINNEIVGHPRSKQLQPSRCRDFLVMVVQRERAWIENLAAEVERDRLGLQQLSLPLEGIANAQSNAARRVSRNQSDLAAARRALAVVGQVRRRNT